MKSALFDNIGSIRYDENFLILKLIGKVSTGSFISSLTPCRIFITLDNSFLIETIEDGKLTVSEKISSFKGEVAITGDKSITLHYVKKGMLYNSNKETKFETENNKDALKFKETFLAVYASVVHPSK